MVVGMFVLFIFLLLVGMPIAFSLGLSSLFYLAFTKVPIMVITQKFYAGIDSFTLLCIPGFMLAGALMNGGGITRRILDFCNSFLGHFRGSLALVNIAASMVFAGISGTAIADVCSLGAMLIPAMIRDGYDDDFSVAVTASSSVVGPIIPPSVPMVIAGSCVGVSVGRMFQGGIIPGILLVIVISAIIIVRAVINPKLAPRGDYTPWPVKVRSLLGLLPMLFLFGVIISGILTGTCTPAEGGAIGSLAAALYALIHGKVPLGKIWNIFKESIMLTGKVFMILMGVTILGYFLAVTRLPFALAEVIIGLDVGKWGFLFGVIVLYIILGCLMNVIPMIMLTLPALFPTITAMGFDPIWFGVVCVLLMELGQITPPVGVLVFALSSVVPDVPVERIFVQVAPFFLGIMITILLIILIPDIAVWLPNKLFAGL
jgi:tripartite ATP-independent transporter DctM subunit